MFHNAHIVSSSIYPLILSLSSVSILTSVIVFMKFKLFYNFFLSLIFFIMILLIWLKDISLEGGCGFHNNYVNQGFKFGFLIFIFTEVLFFFSVFWVFFDSFWLENLMWAPVTFSWLANPLIPLLGTLILLSSSVAASWAHYCMINNKNSKVGLLLSLFLGVMFLFIQVYEYYSVKFSVSSGIWGSLFFFGTGFHGFHVFLGGVLLFLSLMRVLNYSFNKGNHFMLEASFIYWHFVDVVWLFLYLVVYNWSGEWMFFLNNM